MASSTPDITKREFLSTLAAFKANAGLSAEELQDFQFTSLEDLQVAVNTIQQQQAQAKRLLYMRRLEPFLKTMGEYGKVIEVFVNTSEILAFIWGPMKYLLLERKDADLARRRKAVFQWLSPANSESIHERHAAARSSYPNSGRWLLNDHRFQKWLHPVFCSIPLLWLSGKPGAVLASLVIDEARKLPDVSVAFFYCAQGDATRDSFISVATGILSQLLAQDHTILLYLDEKMSTKSGEAVLSSSVLAKELLQVSLKSRKTYIILDGIDECNRDQRKEICTWFRSVVDSLPRTKVDEIRCLFISQDDGFARKDLSMLPSIKITAEDNKGDIETFARDWHRRIEDKFGRLDTAEYNVANIVTPRSQGMFIFAKLVLENLYEQPSRRHLLEECRADNFPQELDDVFLIRKKVVKPVEADHELAMLSVAYLCFPDINSRLESSAVETALLAGSYSFYEYAIACWVLHLLSWLSGSAEEEIRDQEEQIRDLAESLEVFLDLHYSDSGGKHTVSKTMHDKLQALNIFEFYDSLAQAVVSSRKQLTINRKEACDAESLAFSSITAQIRSIFERVIAKGLSPELKTTLKKYYGANLFKCSRINCQYFYRGFTKREDRDRHVDRHDRAYTCSFEGCPTATFGCISKKDLEKHMLDSSKRAEVALNSMVSSDLWRHKNIFTSMGILGADTDGKGGWTGCLN
ncbi:hypothetical protein DL769_005502 [Monosporascus sp. CRB-8-3]|nr:hypothetical protein DL769_005502 [Monosporascus sp. CRB-8-3]